MPSSNKTEHLQLNQWAVADKPKMEDFNSDNRKVDEAVGAHLADDVRHITAAERLAWSAGAPLTGIYTGNGENSQEITLGFKPTFGIVFAVNQAIVRVSGSNAILFSAFIGPAGTSAGLATTDTGFLAYYIPTSMGGRITNLNLADTVYCYLMFR